MDMGLRHVSGFVFILLVLYMIYHLYAFPKASDGFVDVGRCGVNMPSCTDGLRCMNGYCKSQAKPYFPALSDLPLLPPKRYPYSA